MHGNNVPASESDVRVEHTAPASLTDLLERVESTVDEGAVALRSGRRIEAQTTSNGDLLRVRAPGGEVVLTVLVTDAGPVLRFASADIELSATRNVAMKCERFDVVASEGASLTTGGDLVERIAGNAVRDVGGEAKIAANEVDVNARQTDVRIRTNDDVDVRGERIRLNCDDAPIAATWDDFIARARAAAVDSENLGGKLGR